MYDISYLIYDIKHNYIQFLFAEKKQTEFYSAFYRIMRRNIPLLKADSRFNLVDGYLDFKVR